MKRVKVRFVEFDPLNKGAVYSYKASTGKFLYYLRCTAGQWYTYDYYAKERQTLCGSDCNFEQVVDKDEIMHISPLDMLLVLNSKKQSTYHPKGNFLVNHGTHFTAVDNKTGEGWLQNFDDVMDGYRWLKDRNKGDDHE